MFAFEHWADWLKSKASALSDKGLTCTYGDTIDVPECASNPGCELRVTSSEWLGSFRFWKAGTCDYEIMDTSTNEFAADEAMLRADDDTVPDLLARFLSFFGTDEKRC